MAPRLKTRSFFIYGKYLATLIAKQIILVICKEICYISHIIYIFSFLYILLGVLFIGSSPIIPSKQKYFVSGVVIIECNNLAKCSFVLQKQKKKIIMEENT